jgi:hypothetical protein
MTKAELATAVLKRLTVIGSGETADADDQALVEEAIDSIYPQLSKLGLAPFSVDSIDDWAERPMIQIVAAAVGPEFGYRDQAYNANEDRAGRNELKRQTAAHSRNIPTKAQYF